MGLLDSLKSLLPASSSKVNVRTRFEILKEAISGTMSSFYMARDRQTDRVVGLKILDPVKTAALEARFTGIKKPSEGEIASNFHHPRIVETLEHGLTTDGEQYIVMEFLDGPGLNSIVVARSPELDGRRLSLVRQAAEALAVVHKAGYIHRDVCPRNFVVSRDLDNLKLIDFGLAVPATAPFMQPGNRTGTPNYMAPEVVRRRPTSHRLDIFSFGVTAYELFAFELPWPRGATGEAAKAAMAHGVAEPTDLREYCPKVCPAIASTISACLHSKPEKRPASMDDVLMRFQAIKHETA